MRGRENTIVSIEGWIVRGDARRGDPKVSHGELHGLEDLCWMQAAWAREGVSRCVGGIDHVDVEMNVEPRHAPGAQPGERRRQGVTCP